jgi:hypothetical protein
MYYKRKHIRPSGHYYTTYHGYIQNVFIESQILPQDTEYTDHLWVGKVNGKNLYLGDKILAYANNKPVLGLLAYAENPFFCHVMYPLGPDNKPLNRFIELYKLENIQAHEDE